MKIDFAQPILDLSGDKPVQTPDGTDFRLREACTAALLTVYQDEPSLTGPEKAARFALAMKLTAGEGAPIDLTAEEIVQIKLVVGKLWNPLVVGRAYAMLDGASA